MFRWFDCVRRNMIHLQPNEGWIRRKTWRALTSHRLYLIQCVALRLCTGFLQFGHACIILAQIVVRIVGRIDVRWMTVAIVVRPSNAWIEDDFVGAQIRWIDCHWRYRILVLIALLWRCFPVFQWRHFVVVQFDWVDLLRYLPDAILQFDRLWIVLVVNQIIVWRQCRCYFERAHCGRLR